MYTYADGKAVPQLYLSPWYGSSFRVCVAISMMNLFVAQYEGSYEEHVTDMRAIGSG